MDKQLILRRLDQLHFKMRGVKWAREALEEIRAVISQIGEQPEVTEMCPSCGKEVTLIWDTGKDGYKAYCPYCGKRLMLCSACYDDGFACDYDSETDGCRWNPAGERTNENDRK